MTMRFALALSLLLAACGAAQKPAPAPATYAFDVQVSGSGPPMILVPGLSCDGRVWDATVAHYRERYQVHVLTLAGFGGVRPAIGAPFLPRVRADLARYIRDRRLDHPVLVGHSLGGFLAFWLAATEPDLVGAVVAVD